VLGVWNCEEFSELGQKNYQVNIIRNQFFPDAENEYIINNFYNLGFTEATEVYVREEEPGTLTITGQALGSTGIYFVGSGVVANDFSRIEWEYIVNDGLTNPTVIANYY